MPTSTFFNLPQEKRGNLVKAMIDEFSRVPLHEASIANIVKQARISRGSFYQYFADKEDAYFYLINEQVEEKRILVIRLIKESEGNLFEAMTKMFERSIVVKSNDSGLQFLKNTYLNMTPEIEDQFNQIFNLNGSIEQFSEIRQLINVEELNVKNQEELFQLMKIVSMVIFHNLIEKYTKDLSVEASLNNFSMHLKLLKKGLIKNNELQKTI